MADLPLIQDYTLMMEKLARALKVYAKESNWGNDDWGIKAVHVREYSNAGARARATLKKYERWKAEMSHDAKTGDA